MSANDHEEADGRICLHVDDALNEGATTVLVRTVDTDVVVILVGIFHDLAQHHPGIQLWVGFGTLEALPLLPHQLNLPRTSTQSAKILWRKKLVLCPCSPLLRF